MYLCTECLMNVIALLNMCMSAHMIDCTLALGD